jgi:superfamily II DNA or RNA helicase/dsRNA-specific ribonuclease
MSPNDVRAFFLSRIVSQEEVDAVKPDIERSLKSLVERVDGDKDPNEEEEEGNDATTLDTAGDDDDFSDDNRSWEMTPRRLRRVAFDDLEAEEGADDEKKESGLESIINKARNYQTHFFELAKKRNIIVHLGTGMGKTLIAVLLIKHYLELEDRRGTSADSNMTAKKERIVFLVPSNALAIQQCDSLRANLDCTVGMASYRQELKDLRPGGGSAEQEHGELERCRVLVTTHGAMLNLFNSYRDVFDMKDVSLLILDECHNCVKNSPYAQIMNHLYKSCPTDSRPRVLGLTASPVINYKNQESLSKQLDDLEGLMDCRVVSVHSLGYEDPDLESKKADLVPIPFDACQELPRDYPQKDSTRLLKERLKELNQLDDLYLNLGPAAVASYCELLSNSLEVNIFEGETEEQFHSAYQFIRRLKRYSNDKAAKDELRSGRSKKLVALERLLRAEISERSDAVGIVFVKMRVTALALNHYFSTTSVDGLCDSASAPGSQPIVGPQDCGETIVSEITMPSVFQPSQGQKEGAHAMKVTGFATEGYAFASDNRHSSTSPAMSVFAESARTQSHAFESGSQFDDADSDEDETKGVARQVFVPNRSSGETTSPENTAQKPLVSLVDLSDSDSSRTVQATNKQHPHTSQIRTGVLIGRTTDLFKKAFMKHKVLDDSEVEQLLKEIEAQDATTREVLKMLRLGDINILIATSVVEEGVDVKECSFVVSFDSIDSTKSYVQMKGRARQQDAKLYAFEATSAATSRLFDLAKTENLILEFLRSRTKTIRPSPTDSNETHSDDENDALKRGVFATVQGRVTTQTALSFLYRFILSHPRDSTEVFTRQSLEPCLPHFSICGNILMLPAYISDPKQREVVLPIEMQHRSGQEKKSLLALASCIRLYKMRLLSDRFLPLVDEDVKPWLDTAVSGDKVSDRPSTESFHLTDCTLNVYRIVQTCERMSKLRDVLSGSPMDLAIVSPMLSHPEFGRVAIHLESLGRREFTKPQVCNISRFFSYLLGAVWWHTTDVAAASSFPTADESGLHFPYRVCCISLVDGEPLWDLMNRTCNEYERGMQERMEAARRQPCGLDGLLEPRVWSTFDDVLTPYIVYGDSGLTCSDPYSSDQLEVRTYQEYLLDEEDTEVDATSPLFVAQRLWRLLGQGQNTLQNRNEQTFSASYRLCVGLECFLLARDGCLEAPVSDPSLLLASTLLPRVLYEFDRFLHAKLLLDHCSLSLGNLSSLLRNLPTTHVIAILSLKSTETASHVRLEWLGKSVLKLILTDSLTKSVYLDPYANNAHPGILHMMRRILGSNERLEAACKRLGFDELILSAPFRCDYWAPSPLALPPQFERDTRMLLARNPCSDFLEALLGLTYSERGYMYAFEIAIELGLTFPVDGKTVDCGSADASLNLPRRTLEVAKELTSYDFEASHGILREALTHPTKLYPKTRCYQRLAWIGDAVLCVAVRDWVCKHFSDQPVKIKDVIETSMVCNETLAFLSLRNGIYKHIDHSYAVLPGRIAAYERSVREDGRGLWGTEPPKAMADVVESLIGAAYVHGGFQHGVRAALTALEPVMEIFLSSSSLGGDAWERLLHHPKRLLKELAGKAVSFSVTAETSLARRDPRRRVWSSRRNAYGLDASTAHSAGRRSVASISCRFRGSTSHVLSVADESAGPAMNRACELILSVLNQNPDLRSLIERFALSFRTRIAAETNDEETDV